MKRIVVLPPEGPERVLEAVPTLQEMQAIVGGYIEHVRVLREDLPGYVYTSMIVNEDGLRLGLPRNERATAIYLANVRRQYPGEANPDRAARVRMRKAYEARGAKVFVLGPDAEPQIVGPAIWFDGYTVDQVNALWEDRE